ncbi:MAG: endonuclease/exonuclease/phosphatase family protein [Caldilineales bacterium]|nr:endonuclease/exonuclease/phosphatase family protein [Caldilineales bacterium]MDW8317172.1 endonuclease/exonuclease/phosphatase family protein [Anaerolineae bacterium]
MRLLTYNIHGWRGADGQVAVGRLARIIEASGADVVALNEVFHPFTPPGESRPALDLLADALGMQYAFGVALTPQFAFAPLASYGNALLSRYPLLAHAGHHLTPVPGHEQRGLLEARVLLPDGRRTLSLYVTHLDHRSEAVRLTQLSAALQWTVRDRGRPHVLMGDFNALAPGDYADRPDALAALAQDLDHRHMVSDGMQVVPRLLKAKYVDAGARRPGVPDPTYPAQAPQVRIDYIFLSEPLAPALISCQTWQTDETALASDHLPVLAELDLKA